MILPHCVSYPIHYIHQTFCSIILQPHPILSYPIPVFIPLSYTTVYPIPSMITSIISSDFFHYPLSYPTVYNSQRFVFTRLNLSLSSIWCLCRRQDNTSNMTKALAATAFPKWRGEVDPETTLWLLWKIVVSVDILLPPLFGYPEIAS